MLVVVSSPPGWAPVSNSGLRFARAVYNAAVQPAQPEPMMTTFSMAIRCATVAGSCRAGKRGLTTTVRRAAARVRRSAGVAAHLFGEDEGAGHFNDLAVFVAGGPLQPQVRRLFV